MKIAKPATPEQLAEQKRRLEKFFSDPENLSRLKEELRARTGLTGNPQYDDFVKRARYAEWYNSIKDIPFTSSFYS